MAPRPSDAPAARAADATSENAFRRTRLPREGATSAGSMSVRLRKVAAREIAIALQQSSLMRLQRLAHAVDEHLLRRARSFERIAPPDHHLGAPPRHEAAGLAAHA